MHASAEGTIVVIHDAVVDRTTDGIGPVAEKTVSELQRLDAGYRFSPDGLTFPWRAKGVKIPTLETLYDAFPDAPFNIEIKGRRSGIEEAVFRQIEAAGALERTLVVSDNRGTISRFRRASQGKVATASSGVELVATGSFTYSASAACTTRRSRPCRLPRNTKASCPSRLADSSAKHTIVDSGSTSGPSTTNRPCDGY